MSTSKDKTNEEIIKESITKREKKYAKQRRKKRIYIFIAMLVFIIFSKTVIAPSPIPYPDHVLTIANGLVAAMSILIAFTGISLTHFYTSIEDVKERWKYHNYAMGYLLLFFSVFLLSITIGYRFILTGQFDFAYSCFMISFLIMCEILMDMWIVSDTFYFK